MGHVGDGLSLVRQHHGSNRLFSWTTAAAQQRQTGLELLLAAGKTGTNWNKWEFEGKISSSSQQKSSNSFSESLGFLAWSIFLLLFSELRSWIVSEVPLSNQQLSCVGNCFGRQRAASAQCAVVRSMWQLRFVLQLNSEPQWNENIVTYVGFITSHRIWTRSYFIIDYLLLCTVFNHLSQFCIRLCNSRIQDSSG